MDYNAPSFSSDPDADYSGKSGATVGSAIPPKVPTLLQREIVNAIKAAGHTPSNDDRTQLAGVIGRGLWIGGLGANANALVGSIGAGAGGTKPAILQTLLPWTRLRGIALQTNTAVDVQVTISGIGTAGGVVTAPLRKRDGVTKPAIGDVPTLRPFEIQWDGTNFCFVGNVASDGGGGSGGVVSGVAFVTAQTLWVRTDGNDANDGSANDAGHAFATLAAAIAASFKYVTTGNPVVIRMGLPGTYTAPGVINLSGRSIQILGDIANQDGYVVSGPGSSDGNGVVMAVGGALKLSGLLVQNTGSTSTTVQAGSLALVTIDRVSFQCTTSNSHSHLGNYGGSMFISNIKILSSMGGWLESIGGYTLLDRTATYTFVGTPNWSAAGIQCFSNSLVSFTGPTGPAISGNATGKIFSTSYGGLISTNGAGGNYFPGNVAGASAGYGGYI